MNETWQYIIVGIIVATAFVIAVRSIYRAVTHKKSALIACDSCKLKDNCNKGKAEMQKCKDSSN